MSSFAKNITAVRASGDTSDSLAGLLVGGVSASASSTSESGVSLAASSDIFSQVLSSATSMVEAERSMVVTTYEDSEQITVTSRLLKNYNNCRAVTYYIRRVNEVYGLTTRVKSTRWRIALRGSQFGEWQTQADLGTLPADLQKFIQAQLAQLPQVGTEVKGPECVSLPSDGTVYEAELAHCCSCDPEREAELLIALEKAKNESRKLCLEAEVLALEVQRRKALLASGNLAPFDPAPGAPTG
jgi:thermitase